MDLKRQLVRCSTSAGANYEESQGAASKVDARAKVAIALKEMRESNFFLRIFQELKAGDESKIGLLVNESSELMKILGKIFRGL